MRVPLEDLASMALFAEVVRHRSFTAAANESGLAKSAVSKRITQLEARLGVRLLTRTTRSLALTEEGARYYEHCRALVAAVREAEESVAGAGDPTRGRIRVNAPVTFAQRFLADALAEFLIRHPTIEIELTTDDRIVDVVSGGYDLVVRITRPRDSSLVARRLATDRLIVCGSPAYLDARGRPETPADLLGHNCLHYAIVDRDAEWRFRGETGPFPAPANGNLSTTDGTILRASALAGLGLVVLPRFMVASDVDDGTLELVLEGSRRAQIAIDAVFASRKHMPARTKLLLDHLVCWFSANDWRTKRRSVAHRDARGPRAD